MLGRPGEAWGAESGNEPAGCDPLLTLAAPPALRAAAKCYICRGDDSRRPPAARVLQLARRLAAASPRRAVAGIRRAIEAADRAPDPRGARVHAARFRSASISSPRALLGIRYQANTLIGSPRQPEVFVVRDDAFDCVTFCEVVLAAAMARDFAELRNRAPPHPLRARQGAVDATATTISPNGARRNIENGICRPVAIEPSVTIDKTVTWHRTTAGARCRSSAVPRATLHGQPAAAGGRRHDRLRFAAVRISISITPV